MEGNNGNAPQENRLSEEAERQISEIEEKVAKKKPNFWKEVKEWIVALVVALLVVFVIQTFLFRIIRVDGHSMDTTLADGERLFVTVTDVKFGNIDRDSVVICHYPNRYNKFLGIIPMQTYFVKRVVGVPGDTVYRKNEVTHVVYEKDGQTVDEMLHSDLSLPVKLALYGFYHLPALYAPLYSIHAKRCASRFEQEGYKQS